MSFGAIRTIRYSRLLGHLLILLLVSPVDLVANVPADPQAAIMAELKQEATRLASGLSADGLLEQHDYEAQAIVSFVSDDIAFQPYSGILRGVKGTLKSRGGNAHDQALTMASLLNDAGYEAQILRATLNDAQAAELVRSTAAVSGAETDAQMQVPAFMQTLAKRVQREGRAIATLSAESDTVANRLLETLDGSWQAKTKDAIAQSAKTASLNYRWVRWREGPSDEWADVHPAMAAANQWGLKPSSIEANEIDSADLQQLAISVRVETTDGKERIVSGEWQAPVANLADHKLSIGISSNALLTTDLWDDPDQLVAKSRIFFVQINDEIPSDATPFNLDGRFYSRSALEGMDSIFDTVSEKTSIAADALGGLGSSKSEPAPKNGVERVVLQFTSSAPDGTAHQVERVLFDRQTLAPGQPAAGQLIQHWSISTATAPWLPSAHQLTQSRGALDALTTYQAMAAHFEKRPDADMAATKSLLADSAKNQTASRLSYLRQLFDSYALTDSASYFPHANILALRQGLRRHDDAWVRYDMTDIVANPRWSFAQKPSGSAADPVTSARLGVWETFVETLHLPLAQTATKRTSAYQQLASANDLSVNQDDSAGPLVLRPKGGSQQKAWWQVDSRSGATVGILQTAIGLGGAELSEETLMQLIAVSVSGVFAAVGTLVCTDGGGSFSCCAISNASIAFVGYMLALPIGAVASVTGAVGTMVGTASSIAIDVGMTQITVNCQSE